jgi:two-component system response regulator HydG
MPPIRTVIWIGPADDLARLRVHETPTLDVVWVRDVHDVSSLPPLALDAVIVGRQPLGVQLDALAGLGERMRGRSAPRAVLVLSAEANDTEAKTQLRAAGATVVVQLPAPQDSPQDGCAPDESVRSVTLTSSIERALSGRSATRRDADRPVGALPVGRRAPALVGRSRAVQTVHSGVASAARSLAPVLIQGETGTGKEIVARRIHASSERHEAPFVAVNCAAFAEGLLESELFGHRRGAFTGADRDRIGLFERAERGTLFLDEIGETSAGLQARLLRVLQEREVLPVGGDRVRRIDVRVIAATHRNLHEQIRLGRFREDLYYRLAVLPLVVPTLRERPEDVAALADHFLVVHGFDEGKPGCKLSPVALRMLEAYDWPGNVRQLENEVQRVLTLAQPGELITAKRLSPGVLGGTETMPSAMNRGETLNRALERIEASLIGRALDANDGQKAKTARELGVTREGLYKKMKRLNVE